MYNHYAKIAIFNNFIPATQKSQKYSKKIWTIIIQKNHKICFTTTESDNVKDKTTMIFINVNNSSPSSIIDVFAFLYFVCVSTDTGSHK